MPDQTLSRIERGLLGVSPERQARLAEILNAPTDRLFKQVPADPNARRDAQIIERYEQGESAPAIAKSHGLSVAVVSRIVAASGATRERALPASTLETVARLHAEGKRDHEIAAEIDKSRRSVVEYRKQLDLAAHPAARKHPKPKPRECSLAGCTETFTPAASSVAKGYGVFCSRGCARTASARHPLPGERTCDWCGREFRISPSDAAPEGHGRFCSHSHRQLFYFLREPERAAGLVESLKRDGAWTGRADRRWAGKRKLAEVGLQGPPKKGEREARKLGEVAQELLARQGAPASRKDRRRACEALMDHFGFCDGAVIDRGTDDPAYRAAREKLRRHLRRAVDLGIEVEALL